MLTRERKDAAMSEHAWHDIDQTTRLRGPKKRIR